MTLPDTLRGEFYSSIKQNIDANLEEAFTHKEGPGSQPFLEREESFLDGIVTPMYKYDVIAKYAAWSYLELSKHIKPDFFTIIGTSPDENIYTTADTFTTPIDYVRTHPEPVRQARKEIDAKEDSQKFIDTHFVQSQLPLLQYTYKHSFSEIKIFPLLIPTHKVQEVRMFLQELLVENNFETTLIIPTNMTQYGAEYNFIPFTENPKKSVQRLDKKLLSLLQKRKTEKFLEKIHSTAHSMNNPAGLSTLYEFTSKDPLLHKYKVLKPSKSRKTMVSVASLTF